MTCQRCAVLERALEECADALHDAKLAISGPNFDISAEPAPMGEDVFLPEVSSNIASRVADECGIELAGYPDRLEYGIRCVLAGAKARKAEGRT